MNCSPNKSETENRTENVISLRGATSFDRLRNGVSKIGEESRKQYRVMETRRLCTERKIYFN